MKKVVLLSALTVLLSQFSCRDNPVEPPIKDPRTYTWTIDTLAYPGSFQTAMRDIWGSSPSNVYVVGHNDQNRGLMFHYDGKQWTDVRLSTTQGGNIQGPIDLAAIHGFSASNIYAVGKRMYDDWGPPRRFLDSSLIIHFDGRQWREEKVSGGRELQSIWGSSPTDVWTAGWNTLLHYDGVKWETFPIHLPSEGIQFLSISGNHSNDIYMVGFKNDVVQPIDTVAFFLYHFDGLKWSVVDSVVRTTGPPSEEKFGGGLFAIDRILFSVGYGAFIKKKGSQWERMFFTEWPLVRLGGTGFSNLFAVGTESQVYHFNGLDWYRYPEFRGLDKFFSSIWTNGKEVFVVGNNGQKTFILRGQ